MTHDQILAAIDKARPGPADQWAPGLNDPTARDAHCDDLADVMTRHDPFGDRCTYCGDYWPCPEVGTVVKRLTAWGAL